MLGAVQRALGIDRVEALQERAESLREPGLLDLVESGRRFAGNPRQDGPAAGERLAGLTGGDDVGDGTIDLAGEVGEPADLLQQVRGVAVRPGQTRGQRISEAEDPVAAA